MKTTIHELFSVLMPLVFFTAVSLQAGNPKTALDKIGHRRVARRSIVPQSVETRMGKLAAARLERSSRVVQDGDLNEYVNRIANKIATNSDLDVPVTTKIIDSPQFDAFSVPRGFLYVTTGLLRGLDNEGQLAASLAHEIAHLAARHSTNHLTRRVAIDAVGFLPFGTTFAIASSVPQLSLPLALAKFSRGQEFEADYLGLQYLYKSGYDPKSFVGLLQKVQSAEQEIANKGSLGRKALRNHPLAEERIRRAQNEIKEILPERSYTKADNSEFDGLTTRLRESARNSAPARKAGIVLEMLPSETSNPTEGISIQVTSNEQTSAEPEGEGPIEFTPPVLQHGAHK
jgi:predicted Zn-dependent protease